MANPSSSYDLRTADSRSSVVRELRKLEPNKVCLNCGERGPQSVCIQFGTFVCLLCAGIHREFNHRVKGISMSSFDENDCNSLINGGNSKARDYWLNRLKPGDYFISSASEENPNREKQIREFIRLAYVEQKWIKREEKEVEKVKTKEKKTKEKDKKNSEKQSAAMGAIGTALGSIAPPPGENSLEQIKIPAKSKEKEKSINSFVSAPAADFLDFSFASQNKQKEENQEWADFGSFNTNNQVANNKQHSEQKNSIASSLDDWANFSSSLPANATSPAVGSASNGNFHSSASTLSPPPDYFQVNNSKVAPTLFDAFPTPSPQPLTPSPAAPASPPPASSSIDPFAELMNSSSQSASPPPLSTLHSTNAALIPESTTINQPFMPPTGFSNPNVPFNTAFHPAGPPQVQSPAGFPAPQQFPQVPPPAGFPLPPNAANMPPAYLYQMLAYQQQMIMAMQQQPGFNPVAFQHPQATIPGYSMPHPPAHHQFQPPNSFAPAVPTPTNAPPPSNTQPAPKNSNLFADLL
jgi:hypothetical protein